MPLLKKKKNYMPNLYCTQPNSTQSISTHILKK